MPYRSVTHGGITLLCFPPHDEVFARLSLDRLAALPRTDPEVLQEALTSDFPQAVVRRRESIASLGRSEAWYAYRDGRYSPFAVDLTWLDDPATARLEISADGAYLAANAAALELIGMDEAELRSLRTGDLTDPAFGPRVTWLWQLLQDVGELHSTSVLLTPDGRHIPVEYRMVLDAAGPGRHVSHFRAVPPDALGSAPSGEDTNVAPNDAPAPLSGRCRPAS